MGDSDTSLLLSLKHPQSSVRVLALEHLMAIITSRQVQWEQLFYNKLLEVGSFMVFLKALILIPHVSSGSKKPL